MPLSDDMSGNNINYIKTLFTCQVFYRKQIYSLDNEGGLDFGGKELNLTENIQIISSGEELPTIPLAVGYKGIDIKQNARISVLGIAVNIQ